MVANHGGSVSRKAVKGNSFPFRCAPRHARGPGRRARGIVEIIEMQLTRGSGVPLAASGRAEGECVTETSLRFCFRSAPSKASDRFAAGRFRRAPKTRATTASQPTTLTSAMAGRRFPQDEADRHGLPTLNPNGVSSNPIRQQDSHSPSVARIAVPSRYSFTCGNTGPNSVQGTVTAPWNGKKGNTSDDQIPLGPPPLDCYFCWPRRRLDHPKDVGAE